MGLRWAWAETGAWLGAAAAREESRVKTSRRNGQREKG